MKSFKEYIESHEYEKMPKNNISGSWFIQNHLPMVVRCCCCNMTMALPSAWIDDEGYTYCRNCAEVEKEI